MNGRCEPHGPLTSSQGLNLNLVLLRDFVALCEKSSSLFWSTQGLVFYHAGFPSGAAEVVWPLTALTCFLVL
jgi:hypothetical protein